MSSVSTFGTYSLARLGIYSAQNSIAITGNNIANVNTAGYTRQAPNQIAMSSGGADRYQSTANLKIGNGSWVKSVNQLRDQYLDLRYRDAQADVGSIDASLAIQQNLAYIMDEVASGDEDSGVLEAYFNKLIEQVETMKTQGSGDDDSETLVRSATSTVAKQVRAYASQLQSLFENTAVEFKQDVDHVNGLLSDIQELNVQIRKSQIFGGDALELQDQRNKLLDELSYFVDVRVEIEQEDLGNNEYVDRLVIRTVPNDESEERVLVYGIYAGRLSYDNEEGGALSESGDYALSVSALKNLRNVTLEQDPAAVTLTTNSGDASSLPAEGIENGVTYQYSYENASAVDNGDGTYTWTATRTARSKEYQFQDTELYGGLQSEREMLTERGPYIAEDGTPANISEANDTNASTKRGIPYFQKTLDSLANKLAFELNKANIEAGGGPLISNDSTGNSWGYTVTKDGSGNYTYTKKDGEDQINASNFAISADWANGSVYVISAVDRETQDNELSTDSTNIIKILGILTGKHEFATEKGDVFFTGTFQELYTNHMVGNLATDIATNETRLDNYETILGEIYTERDGVMGVYLDDEAMNMMQYQQAYNAACRLMTTYDEMIDKLVNGT